MVKLRNKHNCQSWLFYQKLDKIQMDLHRSNNSWKNWSFHWNTFQMICAYIILESTVETPESRYGVCRYINSFPTTNTPYPPFNLYKMDGQVCKFGLATNLLLFHCFLLWSNVLCGVYDGTQKETIQEMVPILSWFVQWQWCLCISDNGKPKYSKPFQDTFHKHRFLYIKKDLLDSIFTDVDFNNQVNACTDHHCLNCIHCMC